MSTRLSTSKTYLKIVLSGGDADTNAAVAGAILGGGCNLNCVKACS